MCLRKWYNASQPQERYQFRGESREIRQQTDSEPDDVLWETDSEGQLRVEVQSDSGASQGEVLLETASEGDGELPLKKRAYAKRDQAKLTFFKDLCAAMLINACMASEAVQSQTSGRAPRPTTCMGSIGCARRSAPSWECL